MTKKTALVTGSTAGIGRAIAIGLAENGYQVIINGRRPESEVKPLLKQLIEVSDNQQEHLYCQGDIADAEIRQEIKDRITQVSGSLSLLVNNAGVAPKKRVDMLKLQEADMIELLKTNLIAPFMLTQKLVPLLKTGTGERYIVNISSISAYTASINRADYCISKAGMSMMTQLYAQRLVSENIRVFEIRPGIIETDMTAPIKKKYDELIEEGLFPIRRWGQPEDIAKAVVGIVRGYYPYTTGEVINIDGGFHMRSL